MRLRRFAVLLFVSACGVAIAQQSPATVPQPQSDPRADPQDDRQPPLTPQEEREREIRQFDPLAPDDQANPKSNSRPANDRGQDSRDDKPLPGSIAATDRENAARQGPQVEDEAADAPAQQYTGPAVLSRSYTVNRPLTPEDVRWNEFVGVNLSFDSGQTPAMLTTGNAVANSGDLYGLGVSYGLSGRHIWRHDQLGIRLSGAFQQYYPSNNNYSGPNTSMSVDYTHSFSRRVGISFVGAGTMFSQNATLAGETQAPEVSVADINLASSPSIQIFDTTTKQFSLQTNVTWQKTTRLSFSFGGSYFAIIRDSPALIGNAGEQATADVNYRLSSRATAGAYYSYSYYQYQHGMGTTDANTVGLVYSYAVSRTLQVRLRGGVSSVESLGIAPVQLNPIVAALLGQSTGIIDAYQKTGTTDISAQIVKDFHGGRTASLSYVRGVSPGNGVLLASEQETMSGSIGLKVYRRYAFAVGVSRDSLSSVSQTVGKFTSENVSVSLSRPYRRGFSVSFQVAYRYFNIGDNTPVRDELRITTGVNWNPGNGRIWPF